MTKRAQKPDYMDLAMYAAGYQVSKIFLLANDLKFFTVLAGKSLTAAQVARKTKCDTRATEILLDALVALGLLKKRAGCYSNGPHANAYLIEGAPDYRGNILKHFHHLWDDWADLGYVLKRGHPRRVKEDEMLFKNRELNREFILGMDNIARDVAETLADKLDLSGARRMLDLGGGPGTYADVFTRKYPGLEATVFDVPLTLRVTKKLIRERGLGHRVKMQAGNFKTDPLGSRYDVVWGSSIIHSQSEKEIRLLFRKIRRALVPGGRVIIHDTFLEDNRVSPPMAALFAVNMLAATKAGRSYTYSEVKRWLKQAGFGRIKQREATPRTGIIEAARLR
ncbi:MAG: methyltransferase domain-containing protein [Candidatus Hydrogenedentota bacterium]|nr:MAG: methyltransferase domain-containing protein [Candidatus Hydrogenedentota bacterium]